MKQRKVTPIATITPVAGGWNLHSPDFVSAHANGGRTLAEVAAGHFRG